MSTFTSTDCEDDDRRGFSLVEVVIAVGVFAAAIVAVIGLLGSTTRGVRDMLDASVASRLADGVDAELRRVGFAGVETATNGASLILVATMDGVRVIAESEAGNLETDPIPGIPENRHYFRIGLSRVVRPAYVSTGGYLALAVEVTWPYKLPGDSVPTVVPESRRAVTVFLTALTR